MSNMPEQSRSIYDQRWDAGGYLRQYYSKSYVPDDEEAVYQRLIPYLKRAGRTFARAIDFGCGPTVHLVTPLAPYVEELHLADYLPGNLLEVQKWLRAEEGAHNWDLNIKRVLEIEGLAEVSQDDVAARKSQMRRKVTALKRCDVRQPHPLSDGSVYDLVLSAYCVDAATNAKDEWRQLIVNLLRLCADGGTVVLVSSRKSRHYIVGDERFPNANIGEEDFAAALAAAGFDSRRTDIEAVPIKDWAEEGFDGIVIAIATK